MWGSSILKTVGRQKWILAAFFCTVTSQIAQGQSIRYEYSHSFLQDTQFLSPAPHFISMTSKFVSWRDSIFLVGISREDRSILFQSADPNSPAQKFKSCQTDKMDTFSNSCIRSVRALEREVNIYSLSALYSSNLNSDRNCWNKARDVGRRISVVPKDVYRYKGEDYFLISSDAVKCDVENKMTATLSLFSLTTDSIQKLWSSDYLKDFTRNLGFVNYYFSDSTFVYFNPLTYQVSEVDLLSGLVHHTNLAERADFEPSNIMLLHLKDQEPNTRYANYKELKSAEEIKDRILTTYKIQDGYLVWRTKIDQPDSLQMDFISQDFDLIHPIRHGFYKPDDSDTTKIGSFDRFPFYPITNWISFVDDKMIVAVPYQENEPTVNMTVRDAYAEWEKCLVFPRRRSRIKYLVFRYYLN